MMIAVFVFTVLIPTTGLCGVINQVGTYANWATNWVAISGGTDADDGLTETADYVGNAASPGLYCANNGSYVMFRMRVDADTFTTSSDAYILLFDIAGYGVTGIDYAFAWDAKSNDNSKHGLEMCIAGVNGPTWGAAQVDDIDGAPASKTTKDINGAGRSTDGYVLTTDGQTTVAFGGTSFIDFAVSWSYLESNTNMRSNQNWNVALVSIVNKTDHNAFSEFGNGIQSGDSISAGWSVVPEPASALMVFCGGLLFLIRRRRNVRIDSRTLLAFRS